MESTFDQIAQLFDTGGVVVVTVMLYVVWKRLSQMTDTMIEILWQMRLKETESTGASSNSGKPKENET